MNSLSIERSDGTIAVMPPAVRAAAGTLEIEYVFETEISGFRGRPTFPRVSTVFIASVNFKAARAALHAARRTLAALGLGALCHAAILAAPPQRAADVRTRDTPLPMLEVAPGVFVHVGAQETADRHNAGDIASCGFVIGDRCVAVIDTGGSIIVGERLRLAVRAATRRPICYVVNTHVHPDHIFGNAAFAQDKPVYVGHAKLAAAMVARGGTYLHALTRDLGAAVHGSEIVLPTLQVEDRRTIDLGGRVLQLRAWPTAHTDNDLSVFDETTGTLWLSDLLFVGHVPVVDGSLSGWLKILPEIAALQPNRVISGHGMATDWKQALADQERYLRLLHDGTRAAIQAGRTMAQAVGTVGVSEQDKWLLFADFHRRNVTAAYAELEWED